jgi:integrase
MVKVELKGLHKVTTKDRTYYYAWRGGPRLEGKPGSPEFMQSYHEAIEARRTPDTSRFRALVAKYKASPAYTSLSRETKKRWGYALDHIAEYFGDLRIAQFDRPEKIRPVIRKWRQQYAATPRTADQHVQVLRRVLSYAVEFGKIAGNPAEGIKALYTGDRSEIIWTDATIATLKPHCTADVAHAVDLAAHTGLRLGDLLTLCWSHVGEDAIVKPTNKSKHQRDAVIPLYDALTAVLAAIPKRSTTILTNSRGRPWSAGGFSGTFIRAKAAAGLGDANLHFHDLRGTAATKFYTAGLELRVVAEIMGWEEDHVAGIIRRYVGRAAATKAVIQQLNKNRT